MRPIREFQGKDGSVVEAVGTWGVSQDCEVVEEKSDRFAVRGQKRDCFAMRRAKANRF